MPLSPHDDHRPNFDRTRAALLCFALACAAAALDRRSVILDPIGTTPSRTAQATPTPESLVREMLTHD